MSIKTITDEKIKANLEEYLIYNRTDNLETTKRYIREARKRSTLRDWVEHMIVGKGLEKNYSKEEIKIIAKAKRRSLPRTKSIAFGGEDLVIASAGDMHMGSKYFHEDVWDAFVEQANKPEVDIVTLTGDITDGFYNNRMDAVLELLYLGYESQKDYAVSQLKKIHKPMYIIDGNHDSTYKKQNGALIVKDICRELPNATYMGENESTLRINGISILMWHGLDAGGRSLSQRPQNVMDSLEIEDLPDIALLSHTHKFCYIFYRGVQVVSIGSITSQSDWMRRTNKKNDTGFCILKATIKDEKVKHLNLDWFPCKTSEK